LENIAKRAEKEKKKNNSLPGDIELSPKDLYRRWLSGFQGQRGL